MSSEILDSRIVGSTLIVETDDGEKRYDEKFLVASILIFVARGSGRIEQEESSLIIDLIEEHFNLQGAESLELISRAMEETTDKPALANLLVGLAPTNSSVRQWAQWGSRPTSCIVHLIAISTRQCREPSVSDDGVY